VAIFRPDEQGEGVRYDLHGVDPVKALPATVEHGLPGGTLRGDTLEILDEDGSDVDKVRALAEELGATTEYTLGHVEFVKRHDYDEIETGSAGDAPGRAAGEAGPSGPDLHPEAGQGEAEAEAPRGDLEPPPPRSRRGPKLCRPRARPET